MSYSKEFMMAQNPGQNAPNPELQVPTGNAYQMPAVAMQHPGLAKVVAPHEAVGGIGPAAQAPAAHPYVVSEMTPYQNIDFVQPQLQTFKPQYANLAHLIQGG